MKITEKVLLKPIDFKPFSKNLIIEGIFNPGAIRMPNKKIILYIRIAEKGQSKKGESMHCPVIVSQKNYKLGIKKIKKSEILTKNGNVLYLKAGECRLTTISYFKRVILDQTGMNIETIEQKPIFTGLPTESNYGVEDPRIIKIKNNYLMTYVSISSTEGVSTALAISKDLINWKRRGIIFRTQNKDVVIFPEKIKNKYVALHRPESSFEFSKPSIWISYSKDLIYWGKEKSILRPRDSSWDSSKIGSGPPPIKTKKGWLLIYHGIKKIQEKNTEKKIYSAGATLLDLKNPSKILARSPRKKPLFEPTKKHEKEGFIENVVFPTGIVQDLNKNYLLIYSGEADRLISVRRMKLSDVLNSMEYY